MVYEIVEEIEHPKFKGAILQVLKPEGSFVGRSYKIITLDLEEHDEYTPKQIVSLGAWLIEHGNRIGREYNSKGEKKI